jgi:ATP-binding cassette subfamily F protein uup
MSRAPLIALKDVRLQDGPVQLFDGVDLALEPRVRATLVGANGAGKSTLMRILAGEIEPDSGERMVSPAARIAYVPQEPPVTGATLRDYASSGDAEVWAAEAALQTFGLDPSRSTEGLSGGEIRRAALARCFAEDPDLILLDEPTNHLDVFAIQTLEAELEASRAAALIVSHDRAFLTRVTRRCFWLAHRKVRRLDAGFEAFDAWADKMRADEEEQFRRLEKAIERETYTFYRSITAQRTRNEGRARNLDAMRRRKAELMRDRGRELNMALESSGLSGKLVVEAKGIGKAWPSASPSPSWGGTAGEAGQGGEVSPRTPPGPSGRPPHDGEGEKTVFRNLTTRILRGDRVAIVGPNGAGKTTLVKTLLGEIAPDEGSIRLGTNLEIVYLDQARADLKPDMTLWDALTPLGGDSILVRGQSRHVAAYARDFLFREGQLRQPVASLSGGERNRLLLARALARPANLLVLDEPTNDLDMDTLDLLEAMLEDFDGTLILVSHDRDFIDRLATSTIALDGRGNAVETPGGWTDFVRQNPSFLLPPLHGEGGAKRRVGNGAETHPHPGGLAPAVPPHKGEGKRKLSYKDARRLEELEALMPELARDVASHEAALADPNLYAADPARFDRTMKALDKARADLAAAEEDWLRLEEKKEALASA